MALEEKLSTRLNKKYITLTEGFLTEDGVLTTRSEDATPAQHAIKVRQGPLYDYHYAKSTGYLRKIKVKVKEEGKEVKPLTFISAFKVVALCISIVTMAASTYFTAEFLITRGYNIVLSIALSLSMVAFTTMAFEAIVMFKRSRQWALMIIFIVLWPIVTFFSQLSTVIVSWDKYEPTTAVLIAEKTEANLLRQQELKREEISTKKEEIESKKETIAYYESREWGTLTLQRELQALQQDLQSIQKEQQDLVIAELEQSVVTEDKEDFYSAAGRWLGRDSGQLAFIVSVFPALFIDFVAPLAMAVTIFM